MKGRITTEPPTLGEISSIGAEQNPNRIAFGNGVTGHEVTWKEFDEQSSRAANALREFATEGDRVAFLCEGSIEHTTLWNGALKAGCIVSNLHTRASPNTVRSCIDKLRPRVLVVDEETSEFFEERVRDGLTTDVSAVVSTDESRANDGNSFESFISGKSTTDPDVYVSEDDTAVIMWTSGTTGMPKGWCHTHRTLFMRGVKLAHNKRNSHLTKVANVFTPSFAAWYSTTIPTMLCNGSTYFLKSWSPEGYVRLIQERSLTHGILVPTMWREILRLDTLDEYNLSSIERIESAGESLDTTTLNRLRENVCDTIAQSYAATEAVGTSISETEMDEGRVESVGKPMIGSRVRIVEPGGAPDETVEPGTIGEVLLKSSDSVVRVWGDTPKTEASFQDGWWYSGDLGYMDEDGYLFIEGRDDDMILSKGIKVFPSPIEERLNNHRGVVESIVTGITDEEYGKKVVACVHRSDPDVTAEDLDKWCLQSDDLSRIERPREYTFSENPLPRTASDKLDRRTIHDRLEPE